MENVEVVLINIHGLGLFEIPVSYSFIDNYDNEKTIKIDCEVKLSDLYLPAWISSKNFSFYFSRNNQVDTYKFISAGKNLKYHAYYQLMLDVISEYIVIREFPKMISATA